MVDASAIRPHMAVKASDGEHVGTVDGVEGERIKLTRDDSTDARHYYLPLSAVARADDEVHLSITRAAAFGDSGSPSAVPPPEPPRVDGPQVRRNIALPLILGAIALALVIFMLKSCSDPRQDDSGPPAATAVTTSAALPVAAVTLPSGQKVELAPATLTYDLQRYLAGDEVAPRTFVFEQLNFATGSAAIRDADRPTVETLSRILAAYPATRVRLVGYADARGTAPANAALGERRAVAVADALIAAGVARTAVETASGGEDAPVAANATPADRAENRRAELVVLAK